MPKQDDIIDAEILEELTHPDQDFEKKSLKKPRGTRKKDHPLFTPTARLKILEYAVTGAALDICAAYAGVEPRMLHRWLERGQIAQERINEGEEEELAPIELEFATFYMMVMQKAAVGAMNPISTIAKAAKDDWRAAMAWLEKSQGRLYGPKQSVEITGHTSQDVRIDSGANPKYIDTDTIAKQLSTEELKELRASVQKQKLLKAGDKEIDEG